MCWASFLWPACYTIFSMGRVWLLALSRVFFFLYLNHILDKEALITQAFSLPCFAGSRSGHFRVPQHHWSLPWLSITIRVNNALASPCVPLLQLWLNAGFPTAPAPHCITEGSSWLSSSLIMQVWVSHGSWLRSPRQLASPLACMRCHQKALLRLPLLHILYNSWRDKTNP